MAGARPFPGPPSRAQRLNRASRGLLRCGADLLAGRATLSEHDSKRLLAEYGISRPDEELVDSLAAAARAAERIGYPVVLKACAAELAHKSELGLVAVGLRDRTELDAAYERIAAAQPGAAGRDAGRARSSPAAWRRSSASCRTRSSGRS